MKELLLVILGFILTGLVGNYILQRWQARSWLLQQQFLGQEKEYLALKQTCDNIGSLMGVRIFHMQRLSMKFPADVSEEIRREYSQAVIRWNEQLTLFYNQLTFFAGSEFATMLERTVQDKLVAVSLEIEAVKLKKASDTQHVSPEQMKRIQAGLIHIQANARLFNRSLIRLVEKKREQVYFGTKIKLNPSNFQHFSNWQLFKALFVRDVASFSITRTSLDF